MMDLDDSASLGGSMWDMAHFSCLGFGLAGAVGDGGLDAWQGLLETKLRNKSLYIGIKSMILKHNPYIWPHNIAQF
jgi:hypothetical protein